MLRNSRRAAAPPDRRCPPGQRFRWQLGAVLCLTWAGIASAAFIRLDLHDFDDDLMRDMDTATKDLEPVLGAGNADAAKEDIDVLQHGFQWTEGYFQKKQTTPDAVKVAQEGERLIGELLPLLQRKDFPTAAATARELAKTCRACHDTYKPPK
jgi:hypothetical protein